jgi:septal ring factor EnvC (AmiA/AmiB activator)
MIMPSDGPVTDEVTAILRRLEHLQSTVYALEEDRGKLNTQLEVSRDGNNRLRKEVQQGRIEITKLIDERRKLSDQLTTEKANHRETMSQRDAFRAEGSKQYAATYLKIADLMGRWDGLSFTLSSNEAAKALREALAGAGALVAVETPAEATPARPDVATLRAMREAALDVGNKITDSGDRPWYHLVDLLDRVITKTEAAEQP